MKKVGFNVLLGLIVVWLALLDHCLIVAAKMPISSPIVVLLFLQAGIGSFALLLKWRYFSGGSDGDQPAKRSD